MPSTPEAASVSVSVADEAALGPVAAALVGSLPSHAWVALHGDLGAGKTTFVKAVAAAASLDPSDVVSPTFGLIHVHDATAVVPPIHLVHADLYRLGGTADLHEIGWDDATAARPQARVWTFIEWPERIAAALPADRLDVALAIDSETTRTVTVTARGATHAAAITALRQLAGV